MVDQLERLQSDLVSYREAIDQIFSAALSKPRDWQQYFLDLLICASQLYLDYLLVFKRLPELEAGSSKRGCIGQVQSNVLRERNFRRTFRERLESSPHWIQFEPKNPFSDDTGLQTLQDYIDRFTLHLPEIYEETFRVEVCSKSFLKNQNDSALAQLAVGMQHLGRNHISFVLQALEWAADEGSWKDS